jgi:tetrapyrrole methylase family protein/MazG family protein
MTKVENQKQGITLIGLGPGDPKSLTLEAWEWLKQIDVLYIRTLQHPTVAYLPDHLSLISFDEIYETHERFEDVYQEIVERVLTLGKAVYGVTYAVPGHPFVAETTCPEIYRRANLEGIPVRVIDGLSFLEPTFRALGLDPFPNLVVADALGMSTSQTPQTSPSTPVLIAQIYSRLVASDVKLTLMTVYPDDHPVRLVHGAGTVEERVEDLPLYEIDHSDHLGLLSTLLVPPLSPYASFESFQEIIAKLRAPDGCPWDREQTHTSLRPFLLEEAYEALDALDRDDMADLREELGDLLLQILLHSQIASEEGDFNIHHVLEGIGSKLVRRHPHVFADLEVAGVSGMLHNWEQIKAEERQENGDSAKKGLLDGVPRALPALSQVGEIIERIGRVGFEYLHSKGDPAYLRELIGKFTVAEVKEKEHLLEELLLGLSALAYQHEMDAESILRAALSRFRKQFGLMEGAALAKNQSLVDLSPEEKEALWEKVTSEMRKEK